MTSARVIALTNDVRPYAWGIPGGVSRALGWPATDEIEAELWLGAHPSSPARPLTEEPFSSLEEWEQQSGTTIPFLLKILTAAKPLSLQAHPTTEQARVGFDREEAAGIERGAFERNYKDPHAKPELIVALHDGFQALCGFRPIDQTIELLDHLADGAEDPEPIVAFRNRLATDGLRQTVAFTLSRSDEVTRLVAALIDTAARDDAREPLIGLVHRSFPHDHGIAFALLLNHLTLNEGESLWLPAGNAHAYLDGSGVELMGPSDNVLRGGLTPKHVDAAELMKTLVFDESADPRLAPVQQSEGVRIYRPSEVESGAVVPFELWQVTASAAVMIPAAALAVVTDGDFSLTIDGLTHDAPRGTSFFVTAATTADIRGSGRMWLATSR